MSADVGFLLGYGGFCTLQLRYGSAAGAVSGGTASQRIKVPLLSGNYDRTMQVPMQSTFSTPLNEKARGRIRTGTGIYAYSGAVNFELSDELRDLIFASHGGFFQRCSFLDIVLCDGQGQIEIPGAVWSSFSLQGDVGGIIQGNISFQSCNRYQHEININAENSPGTKYAVLPELEPYWKYGGEGLQSFQLSISRTVSPVYLNEKHWIGPSYLRVGLMDASFGVTCWEKWFEHNSIRLGTKTLTFNTASFQNARDYQFAGINGEGVKTYTNNASSLAGDKDLFTIS